MDGSTGYQRFLETVSRLPTKCGLEPTESCQSMPAGVPISCACLNQQILSNVLRSGMPICQAQVLHRSYPVEPIGPLACTSDGSYLVGGAPSGKVFVWEVASGRLLKHWPAHRKSVSCLLFSDDDSLLISAADDGVVNVWPLISMLDTAEDSQRTCSTCLHSWADHGSSITDLACSTGGSSAVVVSCSLDCTCKVWSLGRGILLQTFAFSRRINAIVLDPGEQLLFAGSTDGTIFVYELDIGLQNTATIVTEDQSLTLTGHREAITALAFSMNGSWLVSASEDCTARVWDVLTGQVIRMFDHRKGQITNLIVIPQTFFAAKDCQKGNNRAGLPRLPVCSLDKSYQQRSGVEGAVTVLPLYCSLEDKTMGSGSYSEASFQQQVLDLEQERSPEAIQMKVETNVENRLWATDMIKHLIKVNRSLRSRFIDMVQDRLSPKSEGHKRKKRKRLDIENT